MNLSGPNGSPIALAASRGRQDILEKLLDSGVEGPLDCAMHAAAELGSSTIIQFLLAKGATLFCKVKEAWSQGFSDVLKDCMLLHSLLNVLKEVMRFNTTILSVQEWNIVQPQLNFELIREPRFGSYPM